MEQRIPPRGGAARPMLAVLLLWSLILAADLSGQVPDLRFTRIDIDSLDETPVVSVTQDHDGLVWFGTSTGLLRYDGTGLQSFRHVPDDSESLVSDAISLASLFVDRSGSLWVPTQRGLARRDHRGAGFANYVLPGDSGNRDPEIVDTVLEARDGTFYVGALRGLFRLDRKTNELRKIDVGSGLRGVTTLAEDRDGTIWIGSRAGLFALPATGAPFRLRHDESDPSSLPHDDIYVIRSGRAGNLWIGSLGGGLFSFHPRARTFERVPTPHAQVLEVSEDPQGILWIGTWGGGLHLLDPRTEESRTFRHDLADTATLSGDHVYQIHHGADGTSWIATRSGITKAHRRQPFQVLRCDPASGVGLSHPRVSAIHEDDDGTLWLGTLGGGLNRVDTAGRVREFRHDPEDSGSLSRDDVSAVLRDRDGNLWVTTLGAGLNRLDSDSTRFRRFRARPEAKETGPSSDFLYDAILLDSGSLVLVTVEQGVNRYDPSSGIFHHELAREPIGTRRMTTVCRGPRGALWFGTQDAGLLRFDPRTGRFDASRHEDFLDLGNGRISALCAGDEHLWIATYGGGVHRLDVGSGDLQRIEPSTAIDLADAMSIELDDTGTAWVGSRAGLLRIDPETRRASIYRIADGLPSERFMRGASRKLSDGRLAFGTTRGLVTFDPRRVSVHDARASVAVTGVSVFSDPLPAVMGRGALDTVELDWNQNVIRIRFAVLDFVSPRANRTRFQMKGIDSEWRNGSGGESIQYANLLPGTHRFVVHGAGRSGAWGEPTSITFVVHPPFWSTWWFRGLLGIGLLGALFGFHRVRTHVVRARVNALQVEIEEREVVEKERNRLEEELRQAQKLEAVGQLTGGVAHDFNNLLTAVLGNLELASADDLSEKTQKRIAAAVAAVGRGAALTQRLLAFSRQQPLAPEAVDPCGLVDGMMDLLRRTLQESIAIEVQVADDVWHCRVDPSQLENALLNLAINARDAMQGRGTLTVSLRNHRIRTAEIHDLEAGDFVSLAVQDTGEGMPPEVQQRAFEPFFTTKAVGHGSGLGLSMVYGFARQSGGVAEIESGPDAGTTVRLFLPRATDGVLPRREETPVENVSVSAEGETAIVVEDDEAVRTSVSGMLRSLGLRVVDATNGEEALAVLESEPQPALVFSDVVLPGDYDGFQVAKQVQARCPATAILLTTGYADAGASAAARFPILRKPFTRSELAAAVGRVLGSA